MQNQKIGNWRGVGSLVVPFLKKTGKMHKHPALPHVLRPRRRNPNVKIPDSPVDSVVQESNPVKEEKASTMMKEENTIPKNEKLIKPAEPKPSTNSIKEIPSSSKDNEPVAKGEGEMKKLVEKLQTLKDKVVEQPEIPTTTVRTTTTKTRLPKKEMRNQQSQRLREAPQEENKIKHQKMIQKNQSQRLREAPQDENKIKHQKMVHSTLNSKFPNFFSRFQQLFGDTETNFFAKL